MSGIGSLLILLLTIYSYMVIAYILMSWFPNARESSIGQMIGQLVEPFLEPFRKIIPPLGMIDISPIVAILALHFARMGIAAIF
ncbi:YggT family protein [Halalkalibacter hemicellulosilyticus]|uniref:Cell division protein YlmG/Ycf19 n=1 Tax=Halalkalibacter hemicellulosilyticusJCM 9152 TaxID=1236971 RepID=W4QAT2_9BACI|nr:YggT family protein [Halalkalibacter hemicellulosilyticus]GAE29166.1 cell division protein YlmG/Ycf19 [Halalkalibacter hemicellulosilyticusJCM 9152]